MADSKGVAIGISADDAKASSVISRLDKSLGGLGNTVKKTNSTLSVRSAAENLERMVAGAKDYTRTVRSAVWETTKLVPPLAALGGLASAAGIGNLAMRFGQFGTQLQTFSARALVPIKRLQQIQDAVQLGGGDGSSVPGGLAALHDAAKGALTGLNSDAALAFQYMQISDKDLQGPTDALFEKVRAKLATFQKIDPMFAEMMGSKVLGGAYGAMAPAILRPDAAWAGYEEKASKIDPGMSEDAAKKADELREKFDTIDIRLHSIGHTIGSELAGPLSDVLGSFDRIIKDNQAEIGSGAHQFGEWLKSQDWKGLEQDAVSFATKVDAIVKSLGGWKVAIEVLGAAWLLNSPVGKLTRELTTLAAFKFPGWMGRLLGIGTAGGLALESTLLLSGDTPGQASPDAVSREEAQLRVDELNQRLGTDGGGGFFHRLWNSITGASAGAALPKGEQDLRARKAFAYFTSKGWSPQAAAGIVAGGLTESGLDERRPGDGVQAFGAFQWHADRQAAFARMFHHDIRNSTLDEQLAFKDAELRGLGGDAQSAQAGQMMGLPGVSAGQAGAIDSLYAERPGDSAGEARRRRDLAEQLYSKYTAAPAVPSLSSDGGAGLSGASSGPSGNARIDVHVTSDGNATATVRRQGDNYSVQPLPSRMPMTSQQGG
jgi:hypothetical protein